MIEELEDIAEIAEIVWIEDKVEILGMIVRSHDGECKHWKTFFHACTACGIFCPKSRSYLYI